MDTSHSLDRLRRLGLQVFEQTFHAHALNSPLCFPEEPQAEISDTAVGPNLPSLY